jgi:hypothetical protein
MKILRYLPALLLGLLILLTDTARAAVLGGVICRSTNSSVTHYTYGSFSRIENTSSTATLSIECPLVRTDPIYPFPGIRGARLSVVNRGPLVNSVFCALEAEDPGSPAFLSVSGFSSSIGPNPQSVSLNAFFAATDWALHLRCLLPPSTLQGTSSLKQVQ